MGRVPENDESRAESTERALAAEAEQLALAAAGMYTWSYDLATGQSVRSPGAAAILGLPEPADDAALEARLFPEDVEARARRMDQLLRGDGAPRFSFEFRVRQDDGTVRWMRTWGELVRGQGGGRMYGVTQDVTGQKRLEEALLRARKLEGIGRLAAGVAHDFNNLITAILTSTSFLESSGEQAAEDIDIIRTAATRAGYLVQQLQRFAGKHRIQLGDLDINDVVLDLEPVLHRLCGEHSRLELELEPEPWPVRGDAGALGQVLIQLVANAAEALEGGGRITVTTANRVDRAPDGGDLEVIELAVSDDGAGLDERTRAHLFEPFFSTKEGGLGLGLASSYGIVEQHGGHMAVSTEGGHGTRVALRLPRAPIREIREPAPTTGTRETVLLVEDNELLRRTIVRGLAQLGFDLLVAADGEEALEVAAEHDGVIHVLVTDLVMPGMSGAALAGKLLSERPELCVIYVSGHAPDMIERRVGDGAQFLAKPYTVEALRDKIAEVAAAAR